MKYLKAAIKSILNLIHAKRFERALKHDELNGQLLILMYHRVLPKDDPRLQHEEPGMYVTPDTLDMHLRELGNFAQFTHIEDWLADAQKGTLQNKLYCAITFDDGWADNYEFAFPLLKKHKAPATIFLATDYIDSNTTFWPERLAALLNNWETHWEALQRFFDQVNCKLDKAKLKRGDKDYVAQLINQAKSLTDQSIRNALDRIETGKAVTTHREMLTWTEIKEMLRGGVKIGGHTRSHLRLNDKASSQQIEEEVRGCAEDIEQHLGLNPEQFCYPNGDVCAEALRQVEACFSLAVTTQRGWNIRTESPYLLKRVGVHEDATGSTSKFKSLLIRARDK